MSTGKIIEFMAFTGPILPDGEFVNFGKVKVILNTYLCPHCPNTHLDLFIDGAAAILSSLPIECAEAIAVELNNPQPAPAEDPRKFK